MASIAVAAIKGNHFNRISDFVSTFERVDLGHDKTFSSFAEAADYLEKNHFDFSEDGIDIMGFWMKNDFTIVLDPQMVTPMMPEEMEALSKFLNTDVYVLMAQTTSASYSFAKYSEGKTVRSFYRTDGDVSENIGAPLPEEQGLNINSKMFIDDVFAIGKRLGIDMDLGSSNGYVVKELRWVE